MIRGRREGGRKEAVGMIGRMEGKGSGERKMTEKKGLRDEREAVWKDERKAGEGKEKGKEGGKERKGKREGRKGGRQAGGTGGGKREERKEVRKEGGRKRTKEGNK